jgi:hypothetical protein
LKTQINFQSSKALETQKTFNLQKLSKSKQILNGQRTLLFQITIHLSKSIESANKLPIIKKH